jgi:hypothetical protein
MPKPHTFPTLYDEVKTLSVSFLKKNGYLKPEQQQIGTVIWSINGNVTSTIGIAVNRLSDSTYLELNYRCNGNPVNYRVELVSVLSNLGKGEIWYFVCPFTRKRCRKLYLADTYFYHREAFRGCMYFRQTLSQRARVLDRQIVTAFMSDKLYAQLHKKHFKKQYAGKPTKRYLKLTKRIEQANSFDIRILERAFYKD